MAARWQALGVGVFVVACLWLGRTVYGELNHGVGDVATRAPAPLPTSLPPTAAGGPHAGYALPPLQGFARITERPLFSPSRRPPANRPESLGQLSSFFLDGVVISPTDRTAVVEHGRPPVLAHVVVGQAIDGWTVASILPDRIVLRHGETEHELKLRDKVVHPPPGFPPRPRPRR